MIIKIKNNLKVILRIYIIMPFIVPIYFSMLAAKNMQSKPSILRINYLKNIYYARISSYLGVFMFSNLLY